MTQSQNATNASSTFTYFPLLTRQNNELANITIVTVIISRRIHVFGDSYKIFIIFRVYCIE